MGRLSHTEALLGPELFKKVRTTPISVVGAGGIGCESSKNLVSVGFSNIEIIDLDTIDSSNLNRQFLFRKPDISKSKALVAAATARHFNPSSGIEIHARHGNVKEASNDIEWISKFGLVMNALDNMDARRHVNKSCQAANVPLVESGTAGYSGQATPIVHDKTECYDCVYKPAPKSFPVCTIRSTPSEPIHCIVWGKSYLFGKLFGEDDEAVDEAELDKAKEEGENAEEIENSKKEAAAFREVRRLLGEEDGPQRVFRKVFHDDINRLSAMEDMWKVPGRVKPVPSDYDEIMDGTFVAPPPRAPAQAAPAASTANGATTSAKSKDQKELSSKENLELFIDSCKRSSARAIANPDVISSFDKDDDDTSDFVLAVANLRATAYGIPTRTRFQVKEIAGNIIPAIATTNAVIAGMVVMQASQSSVRNESTVYKRHYLGPIPIKPIGNETAEGPNPNCSVCRDIYIPFKVDVNKCTLGEFVNEVVKKWSVPGSSGDDDESEASILEGGRILADPDFEDNFEKTSAELGSERNKMITVLDEDDKYRPIQFCISEPSSDAQGNYSSPEQPPTIPERPPKAKEDAESEDEDDIAVSTAPPSKFPSPAPEGQTIKRKRSAAEGEEVPAKKTRTGAGAEDAIELD